MAVYLVTPANPSQLGEIITLPATAETTAGFAPPEEFVPTDGDVLMFQTNNGGDVNVTDGVFETTTGFETAAYLSLFCGGDGYWADLDETDPSRHYKSAFYELLQGLPVTGPNLLRLADAARADLAWLGSRVVDVSARADGVSRVIITVIFEDDQKIEIPSDWGQ